MRETDLWRIGSTACTPRQWEALVLVYGQSLTPDEAASKMGITRRAVDYLIARALTNIHAKATAGRKDAA